MIAGVSPDLPHTDRLPAPKEWGLRLARPLVRLGLRLSWRVTVHGAPHVPSSGPVILAANHIGILDGPALVALTRRLTFALVKREAFTGPVGQFLARVGQISLNRREIDPQAIRSGDSGATSRQGSRGLSRRRTQWRRGCLGEERCGLPGHGLGRTHRPGGDSRHAGTWPAQQPTASATEVDSSGLRGAVSAAQNSLAAAEGCGRAVDCCRSGAAGRSRGRGTGSDRATLAGATEGQNSSSPPV